MCLRLFYQVISEVILPFGSFLIKLRGDAYLGRVLRFSSLEHLWIFCHDVYVSIQCGRRVCLVMGLRESDGNSLRLFGVDVVIII